MSTLTMSKVSPVIKTALPGPNARRVLAGDAKYVSPSYTRSYPLVAKRGHGALIEDVDGNEFLDFAGGIAVVSTGHCHPEVVARLSKQAATLNTHTRYLTDGPVELAERLLATVPRELTSATFTCTGSESNDLAISSCPTTTRTT